MSGLRKESKRKVRIGVLTHNYPINSKEGGDAGKFVYAFAHELAKKAGVFVFCPDFSGIKEKDVKVPVTWFDWRGNGKKFGSWKFFSPFSPLRFARLAWSGSREVSKFVKKNKIDYILSFWNFPSGVFAWWAKKRLGVSYSTWALGSDIYVYPKLPVVKQITQMVLKDADYVFGNSYNICRAIEKLSGRKSEFLPTSNLIVKSKYKKPDLDKKKFNFLCIARLEKIKGVDILIEACRILQKKTKRFSIVLIGGGSMFDDLKERVKNHNLGEYVKILGYVENQSLVNGYLRDSDCLIIPSRSESFPLVVTEALQTGLPMVGSNVGDMPNFIGKNKIGFIFQKEDSQALAKSMWRMIKNGKEMKKKTRSLMTKLSWQFRLEEIVDKFINIVGEWVQ